MLNKLICIIILSSASLWSVGQTRSDTINQLTDFSKHYLELLFNQRNVDSAVTFWTSMAYDDLRTGYNNGGKSYESNKDLAKLFSEDMLQLLKHIDRKKIQFTQDDTAILFNGDELGSKYFLVSFNFDERLNLDSTLKNTSLDFFSNDGGKTWKLNSDHWVKRFMYYLYRRNKR